MELTVTVHCSFTIFQFSSMFESFSFFVHSFFLFLSVLLHTGPQSLSDKELDTFRNIRRWYAGGDYTTAVSIRERTSPPTLLQTGYAITTDQAPMSTRALSLHANANSHSTKPTTTIQQPLWNTLPDSHASTNARSTIRQHWQQNSNVHWFNREQTLATETELAQKLLRDTAYSPDLVLRSRPFRSFPKEENGLQNEWRRPPTQELLQKEQLKFTAVHDRDPYEAKRRVLELRKSRPEDYFGGGSV